MRNYTYWQLSTRKASIFVSTDSEAMPKNNYCLHDVLDGIYFVEYKINHLYSANRILCLQKCYIHVHDRYDVIIINNSREARDCLAGACRRD